MISICNSRRQSPPTNVQVLIPTARSAATDGAIYATADSAAVHRRSPCESIAAYDAPPAEPGLVDMDRGIEPQRIRRRGKSHRRAGRRRASG